MLDENFYTTDAIIIGAGPVGLFAVFELGLLDVKAHLIDILDRPGGHSTELNPEKPINDIPAFPEITRQALTDNQMKQIEPFHPTFHLGQMAESLTKREDGNWEVGTDAGTHIVAPVVIVAAGGGSFSPKNPALVGIEEYEGTSVFYAVRKMEQFRGKNLVIAGGGDSALDWAINLQPIAQHVTLLHRRDEFRAAPDSVNKMRELVAAGKMTLKIADLVAIEGTAPQMSGLKIKTKEEGECFAM